MDQQDRERAEVTRNYQVFLAEYPRLAQRHYGQYALYRHKKIIGTFDSFSSALSYAHHNYDDRLFSIQKITDEPSDRGGVVYASDTTTV